MFLILVVILPGPFCGALLGDLGAEVIRVEKVAGSEDRFTAPIGEGLPGSGFLQLNRHKLGSLRSIHGNPKVRTYSNG